MATTVSVNQKTTVHKKSDGKSVGSPDTCKTQVGTSVVPIPYPNIAESKDLDKGSRTVKVEGVPIAIEGSVFAKSKGDSAGSAGGGMISGAMEDQAEFIAFSPDVIVEGKAVARQGDIMINNKRNTPPTPEIQPPGGSAYDDDIEDIEKEKTFIEIRLVDEEGNPVADEPYKIKHSGKVVAEGKLDKNGYAKVEGVRPGTAKVKFPELEDDWDKIDEEGG